MKEECMTGACLEKITQKHTFGHLRLMFQYFKKEILHHRYELLVSISQLPRRCLRWREFLKYDNEFVEVMHLIKICLYKSCLECFSLKTIFPIFMAGT